MTDERLFAHKIRQALDESAERLPYRVTQRLERARAAALAHAARVEPVPVAVPATAGASAATGGGGSRGGFLLRLASAAGPILVVMVGLYGISTWDDQQRAAETADIDSAMILADDDIPISAYADKGFGVFIKNSRQ